MRNKRYYKIEITITRSVLKTLEKRLELKKQEKIIFPKGDAEDQFISLVVEAWRNGKNKLEVSMKENNEQTRT